MAVLRPDKEGGGEAFWSPVVFWCWGLLLKQRGREKMEGGGLTFIAAEFRRDALIAPSGCGQHPGEEEKQGRWEQCKSSRVSSLPDVLIGPDVVTINDIYTSRYRCKRKQNWELTQQNPRHLMATIRKPWKLLSYLWYISSSTGTDATWWSHSFFWGALLLKFIIQCS